MDEKKYIEHLPLLGDLSPSQIEIISKCGQNSSRWVDLVDTSFVCHYLDSYTQHPENRSAIGDTNRLLEKVARALEGCSTLECLLRKKLRISRTITSNLNGNYLRYLWMKKIEEDYYENKREH